MDIVQLQAWSELRDALHRFARLDRDRRNDWWFRGQRDAAYGLTPTIDRGRAVTPDAEREKLIKELLQEFRREVIAIHQGDSIGLSDAFELLARHHGLPSPWLDWTRSPWVAVFFAYLSADPAKENRVAVFALDRRRIDSGVLAPRSAAGAMLELLDDPERVVANPRAVHQRGVFMRRSATRHEVTEMLGDALTKFTLPASEAADVLRELDQMLLNQTTLMYDLDAAAATAAWRLL